MVKRFMTRCALGMLVSLILASCSYSRVPTPIRPVEDPAQTPKDTQLWAPQPDDADLLRADVMIASKQVLAMESFPPQFTLSLKGTLPTPCHRLRIDIPAPTADNRIEISVYSVVNPDEICAQVLEPFEAGPRLTGLKAGKYTVLVNGDAVGEIDVP